MEYAIKADFKYFGWKWIEPASPSRSPSRFEGAVVVLKSCCSMKLIMLHSFILPDLRIYWWVCHNYTLSTMCIVSAGHPRLSTLIRVNECNLSPLFVHIAVLLWHAPAATCDAFVLCRCGVCDNSTSLCLEIPSKPPACMFCF